MKKIYITFDDGPTPGVTDFVLKTLKEYVSQATFFCLGQQVEKCPSLVTQIFHDNHLIANHGYAHLDGWKISKVDYENNLSRGEEVLNKLIERSERLFRPPYGHFRTNKPTVLWSLMSGDFDGKLSKEKCLSNLISKMRSGDIIVFHDNLKSIEKLQWVLPRFLNHCKEEGFGFDIIPFAT
ncbi:polysaccharide deacetylase family protein [Reichenbachiella faecimaris]|nr:polysaccharide deacetylase family protein [Reichenbachiella faecimaris]